MNRTSAIRKILQRLGFAFCTLLWTDVALGCSCANQPRSGFIHAELERLPANARGALFLIPARDPVALTPDLFTITSDRDPAPLPAELSWPRFGEDDTGPRLLARVGPVGGFQAGARYTIHYTGPRAMVAVQRSTQFEIDAAPLEPGMIALALEGPPARQMLPRLTTGGSCSIIEPAVVGNFHYQLPDSYAPYRSIVMYQSQSSVLGNTYEPIEYASSLCEFRKLGVTARGDGLDLVHASCTRPPARMLVRGRAGLLEVDDQLQSTAPVLLDLEQAAGSACDPAGILREALDSDDPERIRSAVCGFPERMRPMPVTARQDLPAPAALFALAQTEQPPPRDCIAASATRIVARTGVPPDDLGRFLAQDFDSGDDARITMATGAAFRAAWELGHSEQPPPLRAQAVDAYWRALLPAIARVIIDGKAGAAERLPPALKDARAHALAYVPALLAAASRPAPTARPALVALVSLVPDDPRVKKLLLRAARHPALLDTAALRFAQIATPAERPQAVTLLAKAVDAGNVGAVYILTNYGTTAHAAIPALLRRLQRDIPRGYTSLAFTALVKVSNGEPDVIAALGATLVHDGLRDRSYQLETVAAMGVAARPLLPALYAVLAQPLSAADRKLTEQAIGAAALALP